jgi:hypothetical protein
MADTDVLLTDLTETTSPTEDAWLYIVNNPASAVDRKVSMTNAIRFGPALGALTATAAGTLTLTVASAPVQVLTGTTTHTVVLPVVTTLKLGFGFLIVNESTGVVTLNSSGGNLVRTILPMTRVQVFCVAITGTAAASWKEIYSGPRILQEAVYTTAPNCDLYDMQVLTAQDAPFTVAAPTGTPHAGQNYIFRFKDNATARGITWNAIYRAMGTALPATTVLSKTLYLGFKYNASDSKWDLLASAQQA